MRRSKVTAQTETPPWEEPGTAVAKRASTEVGEYRGSRETYGNTGIGDLNVPRLKIVAGMSKEAKSPLNIPVGDFFHSVTKQSLGKDILVSPLIIQRRIWVWPPRVPGVNVEARMLALSSDAISWDPGFANLDLEVQVGPGRKAIWHTGRNPQTSGLLLKGSSNERDPDSKPAAQAHYQCMLYLIEQDEGVPVEYIGANTATRRVKDLITDSLFWRESRGGKGPMPYQQVYRMQSIETSWGGNTWHVPEFTRHEQLTDHDMIRKLENLYHVYGKAVSERRVKTNDDPADEFGTTSGNRAF